MIIYHQTVWLQRISSENRVERVMYDYMSCHCDHDLKEGWQSFHNILTLAHDVLP